MTYAQEQLYEAMYCVTSVGPLQSRLASAAHYLIRLTADEDFPDHEQRDAWQRIMHDLTHVEPEGDEGSFAATTKRMDDSEALRVAREILRLYVRLVRQDAERAANRLAG